MSPHRQRDGRMRTSRSPWEEGFVDDVSGRLGDYDDQLLESPDHNAPTNSVMLQYYSKQELLRNEQSLTNQTDNELVSNSNYMVKESRGLLHIGIGNLKKGKDTNAGSQRGDLSNQDLARTLLNMDSIGTIEQDNNSKVAFINNNNE